MILKPLKRVYTHTVEGLRSDDAARQAKTIYYILGVIGWVLIVMGYPFGWDLPDYAAF